MKLFSTYKFRIIFFAALFMTVLSVGIAWIGIRGITNSAITFFTDEGTKVVNEAFDCLDVEKWEALSRTLDESSPSYAELNATLYGVMEKSNCSYLYTMIPSETGKSAVYVVDGTEIINDTSDDFSPIGTVEDISSYGAAPWICLKEQKIAFTDLLYDDQWGYSISVYKPIINSSGKTVGFVACDYDATSLSNYIKNQKLLIVIVAVCGEIAALVLMFIILVSFFKHIDKVVNRMKEISGGARDLTARIDFNGNNELGQLSGSCNEVIGTIQDMVRTISSSVNDLSSNSTGILEQSREMSGMVGNAQSDIRQIETKAHDQTELVALLNSEVENFRNSIEMFKAKVEDQVSAVDHSSSAVEEITANINSSEMNISRMNEDYNVIVEETKNNIAGQQKMSEQVSKVQQMTEKLSEANKIITEIASQTNLLAMNAAIEAAHAGKAGAGFSVVAEEIRKLAETSAKQTGSIKSIVEDIENAVEEIVNTSGNTEKAFKNLGEKVGFLQASVHEIRQGMNEQSTGAKEILEMMHVLSSVSSEMSAASEKMNEKTNEISEGMKKITDSSSDILVSSGNTSERLDQIKKFADEAQNSSASNEELSETVKGIVSSYKVE